jgi:hypothetical protein
MGIGRLSENRGEPATPPDLSGVTNEALRIWAAIEHINTHGNLDGFPAPRPERIALISTAIRQGLVSWDSGWYALTRSGKRSVRATRRQLRRTAPHVRAPRFSRSTGIALAGTLAAACVGAAVWVPELSSKIAPRAQVPPPVAATAEAMPQQAVAIPVSAPPPAPFVEPAAAEATGVFAESSAPAARPEKATITEPKKHAKVYKRKKERYANPAAQRPGYGFGQWGGFGGAWGGYAPNRGRSFGYAGRESSPYWGYR